MAMMDYGALLKINGKIVNYNEFFMDMQKAVGWVDYPRVRYSDCDHLDDEGCSYCGECPRAQTRHMSDPELGEWDAVTGDCRGNKICIDDKIDRNFFAYAGDEDFTVAVYKTYAVFTNKSSTFRFGVHETTEEPGYSQKSKMVKNFDVQTKNEVVAVKIKRIAEYTRCLYMTFRYKGDLYELVYGYGIDSDKEVWDEAKYRYIKNKKVIKFVDNFWK